MNECKHCHVLIELLDKILISDPLTVEEVDISITAAERLVAILKTYKEECL